MILTKMEPKKPDKILYLVSAKQHYRAHIICDYLNYEKFYHVLCTDNVSISDYSVDKWLVQTNLEK